jgi:hypothetical protein
VVGVGGRSHRRWADELAIKISGWATGVVAATALSVCISCMAISTMWLRVQGGQGRAAPGMDTESQRVLCHVVGWIDSSLQASCTDSVESGLSVHKAANTRHHFDPRIDPSTYRRICK